MRFYSDVIARKGKKYWIGKMKRGVFHPEEDLNALETLDKLGIKYVDLQEYSKIIGLCLTVKELIDVRKKSGYTELWVIDKEPPKPNKHNNITDVAWERWYLRFINQLCQTCEKECKQSSRVDIFCPTYKKKE